MKNKVLRGSLVGLAAFVLGFILYAPHLLDSLEGKSWDAETRLFSRPARADKNIVLILVDQYSLDAYKKQQGLPWPWPREMYAALVRYLQSGRMAACFFDIAMTEPSSFGVDDDQKFAEAIAGAGNVFLPVALSAEDKESDPAAVKALAKFSLPQPGRLLSPGAYRSLTAPLEIFLAGARGLGNVGLKPDGDGIFRRMPLAFSFQGVSVSSAPLALAEFVKKGNLDFSSVPLDRSNQMMIRYWGPTGTYRAYPMASVINSWAQIQEGKAAQIPPEEFAGKIVLVGLSAVGLYDLKSSPTSAVVPGVEIQAAALDTVLNRRFIRIAPNALLYFYALLLSVSAGVIISSLRKIRTVAAAAVVSLLLPAALACGAFAAGAWIKFVFPELCVALTLVGASILNYGFEGRERRFIKSVFRQYMSPAVIERMIENPKLLRLGGDEREITSFFSDVAGFSTIAERLTPQELVSLLNAYLSEMTDIILDAGGTLDKYEGDAIVAFWNAPLDDPDHALHATRAALACQRRLREIDADRRNRLGRSLRMRIGLNSGPAVVGNMGSSRRFDYTAMGDTVNLAARLESAGRQYGLSILVGESTIERVKDEIVTREVDVVRVVGKDQAVRIFEPVGERGAVPAPELEKIQKFHEALSAYRGREWARAGALFESLAGDPLAAIYVDRCLRFAQNPPPSDWDGVFGLTLK